MLDLIGAQFPFKNIKTTQDCLWTLFFLKHKNFAFYILNVHSLLDFFTTYCGTNSPQSTDMLSQNWQLLRTMGLWRRLRGTTCCFPTTNVLPRGTLISQARQFSTWYCSVRKSAGLLSQQRRTCNSSSSTVRKTLAACKYKHPTSRLCSFSV